jgi:hypothetical protein
VWQSGAATGDGAFEKTLEPALCGWFDCHFLVIYKPLPKFVASPLGTGPRLELCSLPGRGFRNGMEHVEMANEKQNPRNPQHQQGNPQQSGRASPASSKVSPVSSIKAVNRSQVRADRAVSTVA